MPEDEKVFAYLRTTDKEQWLVAANLSEEETSTDILRKCIRQKVEEHADRNEEIKIGNYERTDLAKAFRPYEAFMMKIR